MSRLLLKTDVSGYVKDEETGVVINTDFSDYDRYTSQKNQHKEYLKTKEDIAHLQTEMEELKKLLLEKAKNG
jgi:hypothetical protein